MENVPIVSMSNPSMIEGAFPVSNISSFPNLQLISLLLKQTVNKHKFCNIGARWGLAVSI